MLQFFKRQNDEAESTEVSDSTIPLNVESSEQSYIDITFREETTKSPYKLKTIHIAPASKTYKLTLLGNLSGSFEEIFEVERTDTDTDILIINDLDTIYGYPTRIQISNTSEEIDFKVYLLAEERDLL